MKTEKRQNPQRFEPMLLKTYENAGGGRFRCQSKSEGCIWMQNTASGWTCNVHGLVRYEDGTIEWDYSTGGHFEKLPDTEPAETFHRQRSMMNAMLCFMI